MVIKVIKVSNYKQEHVGKLQESLGLFQLCINSVDFQSEVMSHTPFDTLSNLSNQDIYKLIMSGKQLGDDPDQTADLDLTLLSTNSIEAVGYTIGTRIYTFRNQFLSLSGSALAGHFAHEYCHTLGFSDPSDLSKHADNVPYEIGRIILELAIANRLDIV